jgi:hypothetical protein
MKKVMAEKSSRKRPSPKVKDATEAEARVERRDRSRRRQ